MRKDSACVVAVGALSLSLLLFAVPARAQNFQNGSAETVWPGFLRLTASPAQMFGRDGGPDRTGGAFRLGYGVSDSFDVEAKTAFFNGVALVGGDAQFRVLHDPRTSVSFSIGAHQALMTSAPDSTALDLAGQLSQRLGRRLELHGGAAFSWETINGPGGSDFTRFYLVPGMRYGVAHRLDLLVEAGVGLNDNSPNFLTVGLAMNVPVSAAARGRRR
jgi:hypothetical protein